MTDKERKALFSSKDFENKYTYQGEDLGSEITEDGVSFALWAPTASEVLLNLYRYGSREEAEIKDQEDLILSMPMLPGAQGVWRAKCREAGDGTYYTYSVTVDGELRESGDPYARSCGVNGHRSMVIDLKGTDPADWQKDQRIGTGDHVPVIWEVHVRDFSMDQRSGVRDTWRGKYLAFTETGTSLDGKGQVPTCVEHLKYMGITHVHLLPSYDYGSVDEKNPDKSYNWGYDPVNYNCPEGSYATDPYDGHVRVREFKAMVQALHRAGIGVVMDVVYNHTYHMDVPLGRIVPGYYYRSDENGVYSNGSACGNDTASERSMFRNYMIQSLLYWTKEYHVDGFRFDLMGLHDVETMNMIRKALDEANPRCDILMYGEPWSATDTAWENGAVSATMNHLDMLDERIAVFCDKTRDAIKGHVFDMKTPGYINGNHEYLKNDIESVASGWTGSRRQPDKINPLSTKQILNYVSAHDDLTLWDKLVISTQDKAEFRKRDQEILQMNKMAAGIHMTAPGMHFFMAGEEFARTKDGCDNSYNTSDEMNMIRWEATGRLKELKAYYRFLIRLTRQLPILDHPGFDIGESIHFLETEDAKTGFILEDKTGRAAWHRVMIWYNPYDRSQKIKLPKGRWLLMSDGARNHLKMPCAFDMGSLRLHKKSVTIFVER